MWGLLGSAIGAGVSLFGAYEGAQANTAAANQAIATIQPAVAGVQATDTGIATQANNTARSGGVGPGASYLRSLVANPTTLTPDQQYELGQLRLGVTNQLHSSDFAGSGRAAADLFKTTEDNFVNDAIASNRKFAANAANTLSSNSNAAQGAAWNAEQAGAGAGLQGAETTAGIQAGAGLANSRLYGQAIGDIGSAITRSTSKLGSVGG
jgi:hypothetical protein